MSDHHHDDIFSEGPDWVLIAVNTAIVVAIVGLLVWMAAGGEGAAIADLCIWLLRIVAVVVAVVGFVAVPLLLIAALFYVLRGIIAMFTGDSVWRPWERALWFVLFAVLAVAVAYLAALVFVATTGYVPDLPRGRWG